MPKDDRKENKVKDCTILIIEDPESETTERNNEVSVRENSQVSFCVFLFLDKCSNE